MMREAVDKSKAGPEKCAICQSTVWAKQHDRRRDGDGTMRCFEHLGLPTPT